MKLIPSRPRNCIFGPVQGTPGKTSQVSKQSVLTPGNPGNPGKNTKLNLLECDIYIHYSRVPNKRKASAMQRGVWDTCKP